METKPSIRWEEPPTLWDLMGIRKPWGRKAKLKPRKMERIPPVDLFASDMHARLELGSPAYRNAKNRSGLGYIETQAEAARMQGIMLNRLVTRRFHVTSEPTVIGAMILLGLLWGVLPLGLLVIGSLADRSVPAVLLLIWGAPNLWIGLFAFFSAVKSITQLKTHRRKRASDGPLEPQAAEARSRRE